MIRVLRLLAAVCATLSLVAGCATGPMELGRPIPTERLAQLKPGASTLSDVLATLGEPQGRGQGLLPGAPPLDLLLYESDQIDGTKIRMKLLMVFVHRSSGVYEGYMWFHSGLLLTPGS